jgi:hypothetical protein
LLKSLVDFELKGCDPTDFGPVCCISPNPGLPGRLPLQMTRKNSFLAIAIDRLEARCLFASSFTNVDISTRAGNEAEGAIAIDPTNSQHLFALSNTNADTAGLFAATSSDGGSTWTKSLLGGEDSDLPPACCDPSCSFDEFGNLFVAYLNNDVDVTEVIVSTDGGQTFTHVASLGNDSDQPTITAASGSVWVTFTEGNHIAAVGAAVTGLGEVGDFSKLQTVPGSTRGAFGDIAIGPGGEVAVTYQRGGSKRSIIGVNVDPDGLGPMPFRPRVVAATTGVKLFDIVPSQSDRAVDAEAALAYDRSNGPYRGRLYLLYADVASGLFRDRNNHDIFIRYSADTGLHFGNAARVNDDDGTATQILPRLAVDNVTGQVGASWLDTRDDHLASDPDNADHAADTDVVTYASLATPTESGLTFSANVRVAAGSTNAAAAGNDVELGDYTGLAFHNGIMRPIWADNSNSTGDNPDGAGEALDLYTAEVPASAFPFAGRQTVSGVQVGANPIASIVGTSYPAARNAGPLKIQIIFADAEALNVATINGDELHLVGPGGSSNVSAVLRKTKPSRDGKTLVATYLLTALSGRWSSDDNGVYTISINPDSFADQSGNGPAAGAIGNFVVSIA